jgi:hypothetical protein
MRVHRLNVKLTSEIALDAPHELKLLPQSKLEQMSICIRYVHNSVIKEKFLGFVELKELSANTLSSEIKLFLNNFRLDISNCVSQSYDGALVMSGQFNGV